MSFPLQGALLWRPAPAPAFRGGALPRIKRIFARQSAPLAAWLSGGAPGKPPEEAQQLIGLGKGLTPAGDDLIGGAIIALHALGRQVVARRVARWALPLAKSRTNRITRAHLACAASGEGHEALHHALAAILSGGRNLARELAALKRIGRTSGMDALGGALLVLNVARRSSAPVVIAPLPSGRLMRPSVCHRV